VRFIRVMALAILLPCVVRAQDADPRRTRTTVGIELDALPYISGGYYASAWVGRDRVRVRPVVTSTTLPSFVVQDGFTEANLDVYAMIVDYFFRERFEGAWIGVGVEYWKNGIENESNGGTAEWNNRIATVGGGYIWRLAGNFYLNPWGAGHLVVGGPTQISAGGARYSPKRFTPEVSLKLGWNF
jgi:hypothetical protein